MNMIGVQGYTIRDYIKTKEAFADTLRKLRKIGYTCLDHWIPAEMTAEEYKKMLADTDIKPLKVGSDVYTLLESPAKAVKDAEIMEVDLVTVLSIPKKMRGDKDGYSKFAADLNKAGKILAKEGLRISYHTHAYEFASFGGVNGMDIIINETENVYIVPDTYWVAAGGVNVTDFIRRLKGRCTTVDFKDYGIDVETENIGNVRRIFCEVGQGNLNWPDIARACKETGVNTFLAEQDICKTDPFTSLEISYKYMKLLGL